MVAKDIISHVCKSHGELYLEYSSRCYVDNVNHRVDRGM